MGKHVFLSDKAEQILNDIREVRKGCSYGQAIEILALAAQGGDRNVLIVKHFNNMKMDLPSEYALDLEQIKGFTLKLFQHELEIRQRILSELHSFLGDRLERYAPPTEVQLE